MDEDLYAFASEQGGVFTRFQALAYGYSPASIQLRVRAGEWRRVRRGTYASSALFDSLDTAARHALLVHAVMLALGRHAVVSHSSAVVLHELPVWDIDLTHVHVTRAGCSGGRTEAGVVHHRSLTPPDDVTERGRLPTTIAARSVVETARISSYEASVVIADAALHAGATDKAGLRAAIDSSRTWPDSRRVLSVVEFADGRAESPGESRARVLFSRQGLPAPELQAPIHVGGNAARVDFLFPRQRTIVEFDGKLKYGLGPVSAADDLFREKRREDMLRELGFEIVRITWADLANPARVAARVKAAFARAGSRVPAP